MFSQKIFSFNFFNFKVFILFIFFNYRYVLEFYLLLKNDLMNINILILYGIRKKLCIILLIQNMDFVYYYEKQMYYDIRYKYVY